MYLHETKINVANIIEGQVREYMRSLIVYGSQYGTTKRYAERFSQMTGIPYMDYEDVKDLGGYDRVIYFGGLYAGGVKGLKNTIKLLKEGTKLIIVTVGLADVHDTKNTENIKKAIKKQVPLRLYCNTLIFHLRGGIDYKRLNLKHRAMMTLLYNKAKNLPEPKKTAEVRAMIETFNTQVDFVDYDTLEPIAKVICD